MFRWTRYLGCLLIVLLALHASSRPIYAIAGAIKGIKNLIDNADQAKHLDHLSDAEKAAVKLNKLESVILQGDSSVMFSQAVRVNLDLSLKIMGLFYQNSLRRYFGEVPSYKYTGIDDGGVLATHLFNGDKSSLHIFEVDAFSKLIDDEGRFLDDYRESLESRHIAIAYSDRPLFVKHLNTSHGKRVFIELSPNIYIPYQALSDVAQMDKFARQKFNKNNIGILHFMTKSHDSEPYYKLENMKQSGLNISGVEEHLEKNTDYIEEYLNTAAEDIVMLFGHIEEGKIILRQRSDQEIVSFSLREAKSIVEARGKMLVVYGCESGLQDGITGPARNLNSLDDLVRLEEAFEATSIESFFQAISSAENPIILNDMVEIKERGPHVYMTIPAALLAAGALPANIAGEDEAAKDSINWTPSRFFVFLVLISFPLSVVAGLRFMSNRKGSLAKKFHIGVQVALYSSIAYISLELLIQSVYEEGLEGVFLGMFLTAFTLFFIYLIPFGLSFVVDRKIIQRI